MNDQVLNLTAQGPCEWAKILKPDKQHDSDGLYSINQTLAPDDAVPHQNLIRAAVKSHHDLLITQNETVKGYADPPFTKLENGGVEFKFKNNAIGKPKNDAPFDITIDVFDAQLNPWPKDKLIGNGSIVRVSYGLYLWNMTARGGVGVTLKLKAVQVIEWVEYISEKRDYGFETVVGGIDTQGHGFQNEEKATTSKTEDVPF